MWGTTRTGWGLAMALALGATPIACAGKGSSSGSAGSPGQSATGGGSGAAATGELVGAWYGAGPEFPDGDQCFIFCANGRLFAGDRPCTETDAGDFTTYLTYTVSGQTFQGDGPEGTVLSGEFDISGDSGSLTLTTSSGNTFTFPLQRTAVESPLCTSSEPTWDGW